MVEPATQPTADRRFSILIDSAAAGELVAEAKELGLEPLDHMADILVAHVLPRLAKREPDLAERLAAQARVKAAAAAISRRIAREEGIQRDHTLRVFREIRLHPEHSRDYLRATGCETGFEGANASKHSLNTTLGAISKWAAGARVRMTANGKPAKIQNIRGEFCGSVTMLEPDGEE